MSNIPPPTRQPLWLKCLSKKQNMYYYFNSVTEESRWEKPEGVIIIPYVPPKRDGETQSPTINSTLTDTQTRRGETCNNNNAEGKNNNLDLPVPKKEVVHNTLTKAQLLRNRVANRNRNAIAANHSSAFRECKPQLERPNQITNIRANTPKEVLNGPASDPNPFIREKETFKTPIQDRQLKKKEELLRIQQLKKANNSHPPIGQPNHTREPEANHSRRPVTQSIREPVTNHSRLPAVPTNRIQGPVASRHPRMPVTPLNHVRKPEANHSRRLPTAKTNHLRNQPGLLPTAQTNHLQNQPDSSHLRPARPNHIPTSTDTVPNNTRSQNAFKTPIQDRQMRKNEDLLKKQQLRVSSISPQFITMQPNRSQFSPVSPAESELSAMPSNNKHAMSVSPLFPESNSTLPYKTLPVTDLRSKLNKRKRESSSFSSDCAMECEFNSLDERNISTNSEDSKRRRMSPSSSTPEEKYSLIYLVLDTNALIDDVDFVERLITKGCFHGLPLEVVIPYVTWMEIDKLKKSSEVLVSFNARKIARVITNSFNNEHLKLQNGKNSNEPVGSLKLESNDDYILNCGLQHLNKCKPRELVLLITNDNILQGKCHAFQLKSFNWDGFKKWARSHMNAACAKNDQRRRISMSPIKPDQWPEDEKMDVDSPDTGAVDPEPGPSRSVSQETDLPTHNCLRSYLEELKVNLQSYVHEILVKIQNDLYSSLPGYDKNQYGNHIKPSWTLFDYLCNLNKRWRTFNLNQPVVKMQSLIKKVIATLKKYNSEPEVLSKSDLQDLFDLCREIACLIVPKCKKESEEFLEKLDILKEDWETSIASQSVLTQEDSSNSVVDDSMNKASIVLENIFNSLNQNFQSYAEKDARDAIDPFDNYERTQILYDHANNIKSSMKSVFKKDINSLSTSDENIKVLEGLITTYNRGNGHIYEDLDLNCLVELFKDSSCRKSAEVILNNLEKLNNDVEEFLKVIHRKVESSPPSFVD